MSPDTLMLVLLGVCVVLLTVGGWLQAIRWRRTAITALGEAKRWEGISESRLHQLSVWINRAFALGYVPDFTERQATSIMRDLFATTPEPDVMTQREWRERRALVSSDHKTLHFAEGAVPSEWATEVLMLTIGTGEKDV